MSTNTLCINC